MLLKVALNIAPTSTCYWSGPKSESPFGRGLREQGIRGIGGMEVLQKCAPYELQKVSWIDFHFLVRINNMYLSELYSTISPFHIFLVCYKIKIFVNFIGIIKYQFHVMHEHIRGVGGMEVLQKCAPYELQKVSWIKKKTKNKKQKKNNK
jgi:hypothetical protein